MRSSVKACICINLQRMLLLPLLVWLGALWRFLCCVTSGRYSVPALNSSTRRRKLQLVPLGEGRRSLRPCVYYSLQSSEPSY